jgi:hypothetical protein
VTVATCKCCGQTLPSSPILPDLVTGGKQRELIDAVWRAGRYGIKTEQLFQVLYQDDPEGGPGTGHRALHALICYTNRKLRPQGFIIYGDGQRSGRGGPTGVYKMISIP